jgi:hypothetical protein
MGRSDGRVRDGCESGLEGNACDALPTGVDCVGVLLPSGRRGTDDGCIGGPDFTVDLAEPVSCCDGVDALGSDGLGVDLVGSRSLEDGAGVAGVEVVRSSPPSSILSTVTCWTPLLEGTD